MQDQIIFGPFGVIFFWQNMHLCYFNRFLQLWHVVGMWLCRYVGMGMWWIDGYVGMGMC